ncbi:hypothetical protein NBRC116188_16700 [Oceaniserpentilla sp. 4NH20-0058]
MLASNYGFSGTTVSLLESYAGNLNFQLTGGSFRTASNGTAPCTFGTSSSNPLSTIPTNATIEKAYLYWAASAYGDSNADIDSSVTLNGQTVSAVRTYTEANETDPNSYYHSYFYSAVADVTSIISVTRNATYTVSNMDIRDDGGQCDTQSVVGGWALAIIYEDDAESFKVLNVYEGFSYFQKDFTTTYLSLTPSNFELPANPEGKHAHITWEGDDTLGGGSEFLSFEGNELTDSSGGNSSGNQFDSYSNIEGGLTTYGVDIDAYDISSYLVQGDTSVSTVYSADQDGVLLTAEIISVSNIPVADLQVTTSNPTGWTQGTNITKTFTISNNGPNDVPAQSTRFTTTLPSEYTFNGTQGDSDWVCSQSGQQLSCIYQPKLRSGWSDYLDISISIAGGTAGSTVDWSVTVDHDTAPYDIFDNHAPNDTYTVSSPIVSIPVVDLSSSSKTYSNLNGDSLLAGDTLQYTITVKDSSGLGTSGIQLYDDMPNWIDSYTITSLPSGAVSNSQATGGANGTGYLDIQNIFAPAGGEAQIIFEVQVSNSAPDGASLQNTATISYNSNDWIVDTGDITVVAPDLSPSTVVISDFDGGLFTAGNIIEVTITLDDENDIDINNLSVTADLPSFITQVNVTGIPSGATDNTLSTGGANGTGYLDISGISFASGDTASITLLLTTDASTPTGTTFDLSALLNLNSSNWNIDSNTIEVLDSYTPTSGNKQLYIDTGSGMSRSRPSDGTTDLSPETQRSWTLTPALQDDLTFDLTNIAVEMKVNGHRNRTTRATFTYTLSDTNGTVLASKVLTNVDIESSNGIIDVSTTLDKNPSQPNEYTVSAGNGLILTMRNDARRDSTSNNRRVTIHIFDEADTQGDNSSRLADGYSAVIINASTVINVESIDVYSAAYIDNNSDFIDDSGATLITSSQPDTELSVRATVSDPFGAFDITNANLTIEKNNGTLYDFGSGTNIDMVAIDDPSDDTTSATKTFEMPFTLLEENEIINGWTITVIADEGVEGDVSHTGVDGFTVLPFQPNIAITKSLEVNYDPVNGYKTIGVFPKAIPGAEIIYSINAVNSGRGASDDTSIKLQDTIPVHSELFIGNLSCLSRGPGTGSGPICYIDGTTPNESDLTYNFTALDSATDHISFSQDGIDFSYEPVDSGDGYDPSIRFIRISPSGQFKKSDKNNTYSPEFTFQYQIRLN